MADDTKPKKFSPLEARFLYYYLDHFKPELAAEQAGYSDERHGFLRIGRYLLRKKHIADEVERRIIDGLKGTGVGKGRVLAEVQRIAQSDISRLYAPDGRLLEPTELDPATAAAVHSFKVEETYEWQGQGEDRRRINVGRVVEYKMVNKKDALDMLMRHLQLYADKGEGQKDRLMEIVDALRASPTD